MALDRIRLSFLTILRAALQGKPAQISPGLSREDWAALARLAQIHRVLPMFFEAVHALPGFQESGLLPPLKRQARQQVMVQVQKSAEFLALQQQLQNAGVRPLVVKGIICRELYPQPDQRVSGDEDLLIGEEQLAACREVFARCGLETSIPQEQWEEEYEIPYRKTGGSLYIELHRSLFPPKSESYGDLNRFFRDAADRAIVCTISGIPVYTLEHTDHLFYLLCHAFKHFLHSGFGIRQVCDIVLYANAYGSRIQWDTLLACCREIRADVFAAAVFQIGRNYLVFDPEKACYPDCWQEIAVDETAMLEDLLSSGIYGSATMNRRHSSSITLDAVAAQKQGKQKSSSLLLSLFPPAKKLEGNYPYLKTRPYLLPAAWASRIGSYLAESRRDPGASASESLKIANQRLALLKQYRILE